MMKEKLKTAMKIDRDGVRNGNEELIFSIFYVLPKMRIFLKISKGKEETLLKIMEMSIEVKYAKELS